MASTSDDTSQNTSSSPRSCARNRSVDRVLAAVIDTWPALSDPMKDAVMAMIKAGLADD